MKVCMSVCVCVCLPLCVCSNCQKGLSEDGVCHGHHSSMSVRRERGKEAERLWCLQHLTPSCPLPLLKAPPIILCSPVKGEGGSLEGGGGGMKKR